MAVLMKAAAAPATVSPTEDQRATGCIPDLHAQLQGRQTGLAGDDDIGADLIRNRACQFDHVWQIVSGDRDYGQARIAQRLPDPRSVSRELKSRDDRVFDHAVHSFGQHVSAAHRIMADIPGDQKRA